MTVLFPDVSNHQGGLSLSGAPAVIAKASEGTTFIDPWYNNFKAQAAQMGIPFAAYHWLHRGNPVGEARHAFSVVGRGVPLMVDDEEPSAPLSISTTLAFVAEYRRLGGTVTMEYCPRWYWANGGSPSLTPLQAAGLALVSSNYASTGYSDTGPGWAPYGGVTPSIWQYTSSQPFNGQRVDFNGFRGGDVNALRNLFNGTTGGADMQRYTVSSDGTGALWLTDGMTARPIAGQAELSDLKYLAGQGCFELWHNGEVWQGLVPAHGVKIPWPSAGGGPGGGASPLEVATVVRAELDKTTVNAIPGKLGH